MVENKHKITINELYDDFNIINEKSLNLMDNNDNGLNNHMLKECINKLNELCIDVGIKYKNETINISNMNIYSDRMVDEEIEQMNYVNEIINEKNDKLLQKNLIYHIENKKYHELLNNSKQKDKIRILSLRSPKSNNWIQTQIGINYNEKYSISNQIFKIISRIQYGKSIIPSDLKEEDKQCTKCDYKYDDGLHAELCKSGKYNNTWIHNEINKFLVKKIQDITNNVDYEPKRLDEEKRQRPDIIIHDKWQQQNGKYAATYYDLMITNIYNQQNTNDIYQDKIQIFNAGKHAESQKLDKYIDRFDNLNKKNYRFLPIIMENMGGLNLNLRLLINNILRKKSIDQSELAINSRNFYIEFSIFFKKLKYKQLYSHLNI